MARFYAAAAMRAKGDMSGAQFEKEMAGFISEKSRRDIWAMDVLKEFVKKPMPKNLEEHRHSLEAFVRSEDD